MPVDDPDARGGRHDRRVEESLNPLDGLGGVLADYVDLLHQRRQRGTGLIAHILRELR